MKATAPASAPTRSSSSGTRSGSSRPASPPAQQSRAEGRGGPERQHGERERAGPGPERRGLDAGFERVPAGGHLRGIVKVREQQVARHVVLDLVVKEPPVLLGELLAVEEQMVPRERL